MKHNYDTLSLDNAAKDCISVEKPVTTLKNNTTLGSVTFQLLFKVKRLFCYDVIPRCYI